MLIKRFIVAVSVLLIPASLIHADDSAELQEMRKQLKALNNKVEKMQSVHNEALTHYIKNEVDRALRERGNNLLTLGDHIENVTIKGDLRIRYEFVKNDTGSDNRRDRFRQRFRLGFVWKTNEGWEIGAGITTGDATAGGGNEKVAISGNDTYATSTPFGQGELWLDYAYAKHKWENLSLTLGQHKNPYINAGFIWDTDVRFIGATLQWTDESGFFATGGGYVVQTFQTAGGANDDANLVALQGGYKNGGFTGAIAAYFFDDAASAVAGAGPANDINLVTGYVEYAGKTDSFTYKVFAEYVMNLSANSSGASQVPIDPAAVTSSQASGEHIGYALGGEIGVDKFKFSYAYGYFGSDSTFGVLSDADLGASVDDNTGVNNVEGHKFGVAYKISKNLTASATYILSKEIRTGNGKNDQGELLQLNMMYKF